MKTVGVPDYYRRGVVPAVVGMFQKEGWNGLFRGNFTHLVKKVPFSAIKFFSYERYKQVIHFTERTYVQTAFDTTWLGRRWRVEKIRRCW